MGRSPDVVVVGAGVVGASCAYYLAAAGVSVRLYDRSYVASGSSGSCEGNVLAWDKELERELPLALRSGDLWHGLAAAGVWTPKLLEPAGLTVPVTPRKGQIVVLERSPVVFRRKLSEAGYVAAVEADHAALQIAMVVESTPSGTALLGSSRQHVGFDRAVDLSVAGEIARRAARFFPVLNNAR